MPSASTPLTQGNTPGSNRVEDPQVGPGDRYDAASYRRAIRRACDCAFPPPQELSVWEDETPRQWRDRLSDRQKQQLPSLRGGLDAEVPTFSLCRGREGTRPG